MRSQEINQLIGALDDDRRRARATQALVQIGPEAVRALKGGLRDPREGIRVGAAECLAQIQTQEALAALVDALDNPECHLVAHAALMALAGHDAGHEAAEWREWLAARESAPTPPERDPGDDQLVLQAIQGLEADAARTKHGWRINLHLAEGRHQVVRLRFGKTDAEGAPMVVVYSVCGPVEADRYEWALKKNMAMPYAALAVHDVDGVASFVVVNSLLHADVSPEGLRKTLTTIAQRADDVERALTGKDEG